MGISINTNIAASRASHFLASNHANLQKSLDRLSSGRRITEPADDAGGLAVAMKLNHSIQGLSGASKNIGNAISFLQVQDGILASAGDIVSRMGELKGMSQDILKSPADIATYNSEFQDLQQQLHDLTQSQFNEVPLFDTSATTDGTTASTGFERDSSGTGAGPYVKNVSANNLDVTGAGTTTIEISKSLLLPALRFEVTYAGAADDSISSILSTADWGDGVTDQDADDSATGTAGNGSVSLAVSDAGTSINLANVNSEVFTKALENVASLRALNGGEVKRLQYEQSNISSQQSNMTAAHGRIMDVDIAAESANLAKQQILMTAQANSANDVALLLLQ
jgi:flagellin-like hook-associated protein FlgL